jgi:thioredoxin reductase (NADPH)
VIIATGASPRKLGLDGETTFGGRGVSYCATCDGPFFRNQELIVVGGGDSAIEEATFLTKFASKVHLVHRRDHLRASKVMQERAFANSKIQFHWDSDIADIVGEQKVQKAIIRNIKTQEKTTLNVGGIFVAVGHTPNTKVFENQIELDSQGYVVLKERTHTSVDGVFAAGDVHDHRYRQAITAAGFGCMAAIDVDRYLTETK